MCKTCGCDGDPRHDVHDLHVTVRRPTGRTVRLEHDLLHKNEQVAGHNRDHFAASGILALNLIGAPGAGKTTLLEETVRRLLPELSIAVIEGDQATEHDGERIRAAGCRAVQINTDAGCHLDAEMVHRGLHDLAPEPRSLVFIENVGNLVCPALFDLGERSKVVVMSVTEGEDKPLKYPHVFRAADVLVLTKVDLLPHLRFDVERCLANARRTRPDLTVFRVSATSGAGLDDWCGWLQRQVPQEAAR